MSEDISGSGKIPKKLFRVMLKQIWRLLSTNAVQKLLENVRNICLMIYQTQKKFPKNYCESFCAQSETIFHFGTPEIDRNQSQDMSDDISEPGKISKIIPSRLKHIERLFLIIALQKPFHQSRTLQLNVNHSKENSKKLFQATQSILRDYF